MDFFVVALTPFIINNRMVVTCKTGRTSLLIKLS